MQGRSASINHIHITRTRDDCEFFLVTEGDLYIKQSGIKYHLKRGDYFISEKNAEYGGYIPYEGYAEKPEKDSLPHPNLVFYWLHFDYEDGAAFFNGEIGESDFTIPVFGSLENNSSILVLLSLIHQYSLDKKKESVISCLIGALLRDISENSNSPKKTSEKHTEFQNILLYFQYDPKCNEIHDLKSMAAFFGYSEKYLTILFKRYTGMSPVQYLIETKMSRAKNMLVDTKMSVKEIAATLNYEYYYFMKLFKRRVGLSPEKFRKAITADCAGYARSVSDSEATQK